ncbi:MAG: portal protein [Alphaproteobacteria bacterium]
MNKETLIRQFEKSQITRQTWESVWQECYAYALPDRGLTKPMDKTSPNLYDSTASDGVDQLAANLLAEMTPPWGDWFSLQSMEENPELSLRLSKGEKQIKAHLDRSNFSIEIHQCYLDLITIGTACLLIEDAPIGQSSAFNFKAIPMRDIFISESQNGRPETIFYKRKISGESFLNRWKDAPLTAKSLQKINKNPDEKITILEKISPHFENGISLGYTYTACTLDTIDLTKESEGILSTAHFETSPFLVFRWMKTPSDLYGRSPIMKALPDIKTANKVVELVLKNANLAVSGIWMADDDGVLNPANISLQPGTIIPKAVGSQGLTPLQTATNFDISNLVLEDLRKNIRQSLLMDKFGSRQGAAAMTATEVLQRASETARILGATYGRLQSELLTPLIKRLVSILQRRGEIDPLDLDGLMSVPVYKSSLNEIRKKQELQKTLDNLKVIEGLNLPLHAVLNVPLALEALMEKLEFPKHLVEIKEIQYVSKTKKESDNV